jgi:hypothetical protein
VGQIGLQNIGGCYIYYKGSKSFLYVMLIFDYQVLICAIWFKNSCILFLIMKQANIWYLILNILWQILFLLFSLFSTDISKNMRPIEKRKIIEWRAFLGHFICEAIENFVLNCIWSIKVIQTLLKCNWYITWG